MTVICVLLVVMIIELWVIATTLITALQDISDNISGFRNETRNFRYPDERPGSRPSTPIESQPPAEIGEQTQHRESDTRPPVS